MLALTLAVVSWYIIAPFPDKSLPEIATMNYKIKSEQDERALTIANHVSLQQIKKIVKCKSGRAVRTARKRIVVEYKGGTDSLSMVQYSMIRQWRSIQGMAIKDGLLCTEMRLVRFHWYLGVFDGWTHSTRQLSSGKNDMNSIIIYLEDDNRGLRTTHNNQSLWSTCLCDESSFHSIFEKWDCLPCWHRIVLSLSCTQHAHMYLIDGWFEFKLMHPAYTEDMSDWLSGRHFTNLSAHHVLLIF